MVKFLKLIAIFTVIFGLIGGAAYGVYKLVLDNQGNNDILTQIGKIIGVKNGKVNVLILGTDGSSKRTDTIMVASFDPSTKKVSIISIPRDTRVSDSIDKKINSVNEKKEGPKAVEKDVESILNIPINYYALIKLQGFRELIDDIGGVPIDIPIDMKYSDPYQHLEINLKKGYQVLNGSQAEGFVRFRHGYANADLGRIKAQQAFISACITQITKPQNIIKLPSLIKIGLSSVETDMPLDKIMSYANDAVKINKDNITMATLPGTPKYIGGLSFYVCDQEKTKQMINEMFGNPNSVDQVDVKKNSTVKVEVYNGTDLPGLATRVASKLKMKGYNIVKIANYDDSYIQTTKIYERNKNADGKAIKNVLGIGSIQSQYNNSNADISIILGEDADDTAQTGIDTNTQSKLSLTNNNVPLQTEKPSNVNEQKPTKDQNSNSSNINNDNNTDTNIENNNTNNQNTEDGDKQTNVGSLVTIYYHIEGDGTNNSISFDRSSISLKKGQRIDIVPDAYTQDNEYQITNESKIDPNILSFDGQYYIAKSAGKAQFVYCIANDINSKGVLEVSVN